MVQMDCCQSRSCSHRFLDRRRRAIHVHPQRLIAETVSLVQHIQVLDMDHSIRMEHSYGFLGLAREGLERYLPLRRDWVFKCRFVSDLCFGNAASYL